MIQKIYLSQIAVKIWNLICAVLAATPLEASRGTGKKGKSRPYPILNLSFKKVKNIFFWVEGEGVGEDTLSKNSLKPSQDL